METKFKVGNRVRIVWRPPLNKRHLFGDVMLKALEKDQIIAEVIPFSKVRHLSSYRFDCDGLRGIDFFAKEIKLLPLIPLAIHKNGLPKI